MFEDNSVWMGRWENDQPVEAGSTQPFAAQSNCPKIYVQDLLNFEQNVAFAAKGAAPAGRLATPLCPSAIAVRDQQDSKSGTLRT